MTRQEIRNMTPEEREAFICGQLFNIYRLFPRLKPRHRRETIAMIKPLAHVGPPEEQARWRLIVGQFQKLADHCRSLGA